MSMLLKTIYRFCIIHAKIPQTFFSKIEKILSFIFTTKDPKQPKEWTLRTSYFLISRPVVVIKTIFYWPEDRPMNQESKAQITSHVHNQLYINKKANNMQCKEDHLFNKRWESWISTSKWIKFCLFLYHN